MHLRRDYRCVHVKSKSESKIDEGGVYWFKGLFHCTAGVLFYLECCIRLLALVFFYHTL